MSMQSTNSSGLISSSTLLNQIKFWFFLPSQIASAIFTVYLFLQYVKRTDLRRSIFYDAIIIFLFNNFVFIMMPLSASEAFFFTSQVRPASDLYCALWTWISYSTDISNLILMAFTCIERHWLLFRFNPLENRRHRLFYHHLPVVLCTIYPWIFYFIFIFLYRCDSTFDYSQLLCSIPCYFSTASIANYDTFANNWMPIVSIPVFSVALVIRFVLGRNRMQRGALRRKRNRKMIIQLTSIATLYFLMWAPLQVVTVYDNLVLNGIAPDFVVNYFYLMPYFVHLLYPFVVLCFYPELRRRGRPIAPIQDNIQLNLITKSRVRGPSYR